MYACLCTHVYVCSTHVVCISTLVAIYVYVSYVLSMNLYYYACTYIFFITKWFLLRNAITYCPIFLEMYKMCIIYIKL